MHPEEPTRAQVQPPESEHLARVADGTPRSEIAIPVAVFDAVLLAAGRSERMGRDKALIPGSWGPALWQRQWRLLESAAPRRRWLSVRPEQTWVPADVATVLDPERGGGPLAGILAAWDVSTASHLLVLAVDLPLLPDGWFTTLRARCGPDTGAAGRHPDGRFEPLAAIYPRAWRDRWIAAFHAGARSLQRLLAAETEAGRLWLHSIAPAETRWFANLNTPADLTAPPGGAEP